MSQLAEVDILKADDAALRVLAAQAMGWVEDNGSDFIDLPVWRPKEGGRWIHEVGAWKPEQDLNDAVALAEHVCSLWTIGKDEDTGRYEGWSGSCEAVSDSPARALTRSVLLALQAAQRQEQHSDI